MGHMPLVQALPLSDTPGPHYSLLSPAEHLAFVLLVQWIMILTKGSELIGLKWEPNYDQDVWIQSSHR